MDKGLFTIALSDFFSEVKILETRLGRRVLCNQTLYDVAKRGDLAYVGDVVQLYQAAPS